MKFMKTGFEFKMKHTFDVRKKKSNDIITKYPDKVCVILENGDNTIPELNNSQFLLDRNVTIGQLLYILRKRAQIEQYDSIYLFIENGYIPISSDKIGKIYDKYVDADGFLYMSFCREKTFG